MHWLTKRLFCYFIEQKLLLVSSECIVAVMKYHLFFESYISFSTQCLLVQYPSLSQHLLILHLILCGIFISFEEIDLPVNEAIIIKSQCYDLFISDNASVEVRTSATMGSFTEQFHIGE